MCVSACALSYPGLMHRDKRTVKPAGKTNMSEMICAAAVEAMWGGNRIGHAQVTPFQLSLRFLGLESSHPVTKGGQQSGEPYWVY